MKRTTRLIAAVLAAVLSLAMIPFSASAVSTALQGKTIVALGDSMTRFGTTSSGATSSTGEKTYPYYLGTNDYLGVPIINAGVGGDTTNHAMARFKTDVLDKNPDVVIICLGMNDQATIMSSGQPNVSLSVYRSNLDYFAKTLKAAGSDVVFVTPSPVNTNSGYYVPGGYGLDYSGEHMTTFCNAIREVAYENDCTLVDIQYECAFENMNTFAQYGDGIHHSDYGRKQYAKYISDHLQAVYDGTNKATMTVKCVDEKGNLLSTETLVGAAGAHITVASPVIEGYETADADVQTTFVNGKEFTFTYSLEIYELLEQAEKLIAFGYNEAIIDLIRETVAEAKAVAESADPDTAKLMSLAETLSSLVATANGDPYVVSKGKPYTTTAPNRGSIHDDDQIRLTDGEKGSTDGGTGRYSGWNATSAIDVTIDLGEKTSVNSFSAYAASDGGWGIKKPAKLTVSISDDGVNFTEVASQTALKTTFNLVGKKGTWDTTIITAVTEEPVSAKYVRLSVTPNGSFVWLSEVEAALRTRPAEDVAYVTGINRMVYGGDCIVFTPDFGTVAPATANHKWTRNLLAQWDAENENYVVISAFDGSGDATESITLEEGQILIACHSDEAAANCIINKNRIATLAEGDTFSLSGIDADSAKAGLLPYIKLLDFEGEKPLENGKTFWVTHFNNNTVEGAGTIFTNPYSGCAWWLNIAFKPVEGLENVYEVVEKSDGASNGSGKVLTIPEGGFVWAVNNGNNYVNINGDEHDANFSNQASRDAVAAGRALKVGDMIQISGINLLTQEIPTSTEYIDYYSSAYVCTAKFAIYDPNVPVEPEYTLGDVNDDGAINQYDYILVKRHYFGTRILTDAEMLPADVNNDKKVDQYDYILICRHYFGTYKIG